MERALMLSIVPVLVQSITFRDLMGEPLSRLVLTTCPALNVSGVELVPTVIVAPLALASCSRVR